MRLQRHPLVRFHHAASGRRQALLVGTRLYVHQVMSTLRACDNNIDTAAEYLGVAPRQVRAALDYYAEFAADVDQDAAIAQRVATDERALWDRQQMSTTTSYLNLAEIRKGEVEVLAGGGFRYRPEDGHLLEALVRDAAQDDQT